MDNKKDNAYYVKKIVTDLAFVLEQTKGLTQQELEENEILVDYYETEHYIFTHGWIPCTPISISPYVKEYVPIENWRNADSATWDKARWINGMEAANAGVVVDGKTIVCGHWHCSFGHANYEGDGGEFDNNPNFSPYYGNGIIALDACAPISRKVNCIIIED